MQYFIEKCLIHFTDFRNVFRWKASEKRNFLLTHCIHTLPNFSHQNPVVGFWRQKQPIKKTKKEKYWRSFICGCWALSFELWNFGLWIWLPRSRALLQREVRSKGCLRMVVDTRNTMCTGTCSRSPQSTCLPFAQSVEGLMVLSGKICDWSLIPSLYFLFLGHFLSSFLVL